MLPSDCPPRDRALLALEGLSVGDAFGQTFFLPDQEARQRLATRSLPPGPWPYTDDTLMALSVFAVLDASGAVEQDQLVASLAEHHDFQRGYGPSMHRLLTDLRAGHAWRTRAAEQFGGQGSFGNGAAVRAAPLGAFFAHDPDEAAQQAALSSLVTHTHPEAVAGAVAVALAAALAWRASTAGALPPARAFLAQVAERLPAGEVRRGLEQAWALGPEASVPLAVAALGNGVRLSAADTVPFALWCAARHLGDSEEALWQCASGLGDRDTTCAIVGAVAVLAAGRASIPAAWLQAREPLPSWHLAGHGAGPGA